MIVSESVAFRMPCEDLGAEAQAEQLLDSLRDHLKDNGVLLGWYDASSGSGFYTEASYDAVDLIFSLAPTSLPGEFLLQIAPPTLGCLVLWLPRRPHSPNRDAAISAAARTIHQWLLRIQAFDVRWTTNGNPLSEPTTCAPTGYGGPTGVESSGSSHGAA